MQVVLLRVGIDSGSASGGMQGPLLDDNAFEYIPIPDWSDRGRVTYGTARGRHGRSLVDYFPERRREAMRSKSIHVDPEFNSFTYGDPTQGAKQGLRHLEAGDLLVFYAGLERWPQGGRAGLYVIGYFEVSDAGHAASFSAEERRQKFGNNFHVEYSQYLRDPLDKLVLIKGSKNSRLLERAHLISKTAADRNGKTLKVLSNDAQRVFGDFGGRISIQRSAPRWVEAENAAKAAEWVRALD